MKHQYSQFLQLSNLAWQAPDHVVIDLKHSQLLGELIQCRGEVLELVA